ncbi:MAG: cupin domain-containing protein [Gaiellales bacterium]
MTHARTTIDAVERGFFRPLREPLGITAFGVNALVLPAGTEWFHHYHERQDELYFVHRGRAGFLVDGETFELGPGGVVHVEATTPRQVWNAGDDELVLLILGGKDGYVGRDGQLVDEGDLERRKRAAAGDVEAVRRRPERRS